MTLLKTDGGNDMDRLGAVPPFFPPGNNSLLASAQLPVLISDSALSRTSSVGLA